MLDFRVLSLFGITLILTWLAIVMYRRTAERLTFALFALSVALWSLALGIFYAADSRLIVDFWGRMVYLFGSLVPVLFLEFGLAFRNKKVKFAWHVLIFLPNLILGFYYLFTPAFITQSFAAGPLRGYDYGNLKPLFDIHLWSFFLAGFLILYKGFRDAKEENLRTQYIYIIFGTLLGLTITLTTNVIFPWFKNFGYLWVGPFGAGIWAGILTYGISRHHLLNAKLIATEIFVGAIWLVLFINITIFSSSSEFIFNILIFLASLFVGYLLVRSVMREVEQREELERLSGQLAAANIELKKLDAAKSEFVSIASHQLRAPLTVIKGYISMFLDGTFGSVAQSGTEALSKVAFSTEQLVKLVGDLLNLSRIESGKLRYTLARTDILSLIQKIIDEFKVSFEKKKIKLELLNSLSEPIYLYVDADKIREMTMNLVSNSLKYAYKKVEIRVEDLGRGTHEAMIRLIVKDDGIGIKSEDLPRIFTKFQRTAEAQKVDPNGMGIGLYYAKRVVEDHGGKMRVESEGPGKGSTFIVDLPSNK